jgi:hypothetical protein
VALARGRGADDEDDQEGEEGGEHFRGGRCCCFRWLDGRRVEWEMTRRHCSGAARKTT